jgi:hypothetical protein
VKVILPSRLLGEAADELVPVRDEVVVIGAAALDVALADAEVAITATRDVDVVVPVERAADVVSHLERAEMRRSELAHERSFTWVKGDLKVQLVRSIHPFAKPPARGLPENAVFGMAERPVHQLAVAFVDAPYDRRLTCARAACLLALKEAAFGRTRAPDGTPVERDFHDAFLLIDAAADDVLAGLEVAEYEVRRRAARAIDRLAGGGDETAAAGRQMMRLDPSLTQRRAEAAVRRSARRLQRRLDATR